MAGLGISRMFCFILKAMSRCVYHFQRNHWYKNVFDNILQLSPNFTSSTIEYVFKSKYITRLLHIYIRVQNDPLIMLQTVKVPSLNDLHTMNLALASE